MLTPWLWAIFTIVAAISQTARNAMQVDLIAKLGTVGATHVRFLFGLPFAVLFLIAIMAATGGRPPPLNPAMLAWTAFGALSQILATALMLAAMRERSFVVATALTKIEPLWVAVLGLAALGDPLTGGLVLAMVLATGGVMIMSWPGSAAWSIRPVVQGIVAGALFGCSAIGFRGGIRELGGDDFVIGASTTLVTALAIQTVTLSAYLAWRERGRLGEIFRAWRPSAFAGFMGAFGSQFWFLAFAIESAARVRTLALIEILFAQMVSRRLFNQSLASREAIGILLIVVGVAWLLNN